MCHNTNPLAFLCLAVTAFGIFVTSLTAQDKGPFQDNLLSALFSAEVLRDLELLDEQKKELKQITGEIRQARNQITTRLKEYASSGVSQDKIEAKRQESIKQIEDKKAEALKQINDVLLPHQMDRLRQSTVQVMMKQFARHEKVQSGLLTSQMKQYLEIDDEQAKKIAETAKELREELAEKIKKLNEEALEKLLSELSAEQRKKYKELIGDHVKGLR